MKKLLLLLTVIIILFSFAACNKNNENLSSNDSTLSTFTVSTTEINSDFETDTVIFDDCAENNQDNCDTTQSTTENNLTSEQTTVTENLHIHTFSEATCMEVAKCTCGATQGSTLPHDFEPATCQSPKRCKNCNMTSGTNGTHNYVNGRCTVCNGVNNETARSMLYNWFSENYVTAEYGKYYYLPSNTSYYLSAMQTGDIFLYYLSDNEFISLSIYGFEENTCYLTYIYDGVTVEGEFPLDSLHSANRIYFNTMESWVDSDTKAQLIAQLRGKIDAFMLKFENEVFKPNVNITLKDLGFTSY